MTTIVSKRLLGGTSDNDNTELCKGIATPSDTPAAGSFLLYFKADGNLYKKDSGGVETQLNSAGGSGFTYPAPDIAEALTGNTYNSKPEYIRIFTGTTGATDSGNVAHSIGLVGIADEIIDVFGCWINGTFGKSFPGANDDGTKSIEVVNVDLGTVNINFRSNDARYNTKPYQFMITYTKV